MTSPQVVIMDNAGKEAITKFLVNRGITPTTIYLDITKETMLERLGIKRRESSEMVDRRLKDLEFFNKNGYDHVIDANGSTDRTYKEFLNIMASWQDS